MAESPHPELVEGRTRRNPSLLQVVVATRKREQPGCLLTWERRHPRPVPESRPTLRPRNPPSCPQFCDRKGTPESSRSPGATKRHARRCVSGITARLPGGR